MRAGRGGNDKCCAPRQAGFGHGEGGEEAPVASCSEGGRQRALGGAPGAAPPRAVVQGRMVEASRGSPCWPPCLWPPLLPPFLFLAAGKSRVGWGEPRTGFARLVAVLPWHRDFFFFCVCSAQVSLWPPCQRSAAGWTSSGLGSQQRGASRALALAGSCAFLADRPACSFQKSLRCYRKAKTALLQVPLSHLERHRAESRLFLPSLEVLPGFLRFPRAGC